MSIAPPNSFPPAPVLLVLPEPRSVTISLARAESPVSLACLRRGIALRQSELGRQREVEHLHGHVSYRPARTV